ncbi:MAG TPA: hypothetical protein VLH86_02250 [Patescibacteria group bacterium]|nr:hypothetical protein [Patescibacteria group bacterium]
MNAKRTFYGMIIGMALFAGLGVAGIVLGNSTLQKQGNTLVDLKLLGRALDEQQTAATRARQDISKYAELNHTATVIVPQEKDQALAVRELVDLAGKSGIKIGSITFPASNLGAKGGTATKPTSLSQVTPVTGISGVYQMPITLQSDTSAPTDFSKLVSFLTALENNRRTAQVGQVTITPSDTSGRKLSFVLVVNVYIKP